MTPDAYIAALYRCYIAAPNRPARNGYHAAIGMALDDGIIPVRMSATWWRVRSEQRPDTAYDVTFDGTAWQCSCLARVVCKHVRAVEAATQADAAALPFVAEAAPVAPDAIYELWS